MILLLVLISMFQIQPSPKISVQMPLQQNFSLVQHVLRCFDESQITKAGKFMQKKNPCHDDWQIQAREALVQRK